MTALNNADYALTIADLIKDFLKDSQYGDFFKYFFYGNPPNGVPINECPCVVISKESSETEQGPTGMDFVKEKIVIRVILNKRTFDSTDPYDEVLSKRQFEQLCEGIDATTGLYTDQSIKGVLRKNFTLGSAITNQKINVEYGEVRDQAINEMTVESQITLDVEYYVMTPGKQ